MSHGRFKRIRTHADLPSVGRVVEVRWCEGKQKFRAELVNHETGDWLIHGFCRTQDVTHWRPLPVYYVGTHPYHFRCGEAAEIVGVEVVTLPNKNALPRPCFRVRYADGVEDLCPMEESLQMGCIKSEDEINLDKLVRS